MPDGRPTQPPSAETVNRLRQLLDERRQTQAAAEHAADRLAVAVANACDQEGASQHQVAAALGVGPSTVHGWVKRGRQLLADD